MSPVFINKSFDKTFSVSFVFFPHIVVKEVLCTVKAGMKGKQKVVERSRPERGSVCPTEEIDMGL